MFGNPYKEPCPNCGHRELKKTFSVVASSDGNHCDEIFLKDKRECSLMYSEEEENEQR